MIYLYIPEACRIDFLDVYGKDQQEDLSSKEKKVLASIANTVRDEAMAAFRRSKGTK